MKTKHTPVPWIKVTHVHTSEAGRNDEYFNHEFHLLTSSKVEHSNDICNATAKLIAAAPDLLEALAFCQSVIEKNGLFDVSDKMAFDKADSAIKKATL